MQNSSTIRPPALANKLLELYCGNAFMEDLRGDLEEMFLGDVESTSPMKAKRRYWRQALSLMFSYAVRKRKARAAFHAYSYSTFHPAMIKNYFTVTVRSLMKNKLYIFINIFGLAIAIGCCLVAYVNYHFNADFDTQHSQAASIYRVSSLREFDGKEQMYGSSPLALGSLVREMPDISLATRFNHSSVSLKLDEDLFNENIRYVDPDFFKLFDFEFIHGKPPGADDRTKLYISDKAALKLFGTTDAVGKSISQVVDETLKPYEIGGVYREQPSNSSFFDDGYALHQNYFDEHHSIGENDWGQPTTLFVKITEPSKVAALEKHLARYVEDNNRVRKDFTITKFLLDPLTGMAVRDMQIDTRQLWTRPAISGTSVIGCVIMSLLLLMIACFNMTNTTLATSSNRLKEIGIRKVMGSFRSQLVLQFLGETALVCMVALLAGLWLTSAFLLPAFNALWPYMKLEINYFSDSNLLFSLLGVLMGTILLAGAYPAFYISKFGPVKILKGTFAFEGMTSFSLVLLGLQFMISLVGIVSSISFVQNAHYQRSIDLGFNQSAVFVGVRDGKEADALKIELRKNPDVSLVAASRHTMDWGAMRSTVSSETKKIETDVMEVGDDYLRTAGVTFIAGRDFHIDSETDRKESVIVTESFAEAMGWSDAIGKSVTWQDTTTLYVVGTIKDIYSRGLWRKVEPMMVRLIEKDLCVYVTASAPVDKITGVNAYMEDQWKKLFPNRVYDGKYADAMMVEAVTVNDNLVKMFGFVGFVAILLSGTGLFTLVSLSIVKRFKEIGIRKVLGASTPTIARLINMRFIIILAIASLLGSWLSLITVESIMTGIWAFYQPPGVITVMAAVFFLFTVSFGTISTKLYEVVKMNPVDSLRTE